MAEMIIPGTYIDVRAEGLISAGRVAVGIIGIIGTAKRGAIGTPITLSSFSNAREIFGTADDYNRPEDGSNPLTLIRALEHVYNNGGSTVVAVRVASDAKSSAKYCVQDNSSNSVAVLTANSPGTWGNDIQITIEDAEDDCRIKDETHTDTFTSLNYSRIVPSSENRIRVFRGITKQTTTLDIVYKRLIQNEEVQPTTGNRFFLSETPVEQSGSGAALNHVQILNTDGEVIRDYGDGDFIYGSGPAPVDTGVVRLANVLHPVSGNQVDELIFHADEVPAVDETVVATYAVGHANPVAGEILITSWDGSIDFATGEAPQQADGDRLIASYLVDKENCVLVKLVYDITIEGFTVPDGNILAQRINESSILATAEADSANGGNLPKKGVDSYFGTGTNIPGSNGADAGPDDYSLGLEAISNKLINIVNLAGQDARTIGSILLGHLNSTEVTDNERIGVIGAAGTTHADFLGHAMADDRVILVAPGIKYPDGTVLPPAYTAAAVTGLISSLSVQTSLTNKTLTIPGVSVDFNKGQQEQLIKRNVLTVALKNGYRIIKGITTSGEGTPFAAIPTRRIVDYAKYGVRSGASPYIGRLNNVRVRAALKATIDAFLTRMVEDEALTRYELEVSATRSQEIAGEVLVVMTLQPTFSIDFIRVIMNLQ